MDKITIGHDAGKIWLLLSNHKKWSYTDLKEKSGLKERELFAAIGWLARENKIEIVQEAEELYVHLYVNVYIG